MATPSKPSAASRHNEMNQLSASGELRTYSKSWFAETMDKVRSGETPYILCNPVCPHEIFEALDIPYVPNAWYSGLIAAKRQSAY